MFNTFKNPLSSSSAISTLSLALSCSFFLALLVSLCLYFIGIPFLFYFIFLNWCHYIWHSFYLCFQVIFFYSRIGNIEILNYFLQVTNTVHMLHICFVCRNCSGHSSHCIAARWTTQFLLDAFAKIYCVARAVVNTWIHTHTAVSDLLSSISHIYIAASTFKRFLYADLITSPSSWI